ncbi:MAG: ATPase, T2SS/T4P/T4SS family [Desulfovibrio sp.]|nr:ATPase, T2SS/T4P/T4SS family [Desulfovibrio sp.]
MQLEGIRALLERIVQRWPRASDVLFVAGASIQVEVDGVLQPVRLRHGRPLSPALTQDMAHCLLRDRPDLCAALEKRGSCDFSWNIPWGIRLRVNVFRQRGRLALVMRRLPEHIPDMAELRLPVVFEDMAREPQGLALITGGTGTGKTHSLAALIQRINHTRAVHVVTLEDPVEFLHEPVEAVVSQRELHTDFDHFATGLRAALRQAPKVIVVGEVRDRESMEVVLQAATTGHLVLATLLRPMSAQPSSGFWGCLNRRRSGSCVCGWPLACGTWCASSCCRAGMGRGGYRFLRCCATGCAFGS